MRKETYANKLNELLGITEKADEIVSKTKQVGKSVEVPEDAIQDFRAAQGLIYFLQAPELFSHRTCKECGADYLVSRQHVAFCSYDCIRASLRKIGIEWSKYEDIEALVLDKQVYNGQEPIWIRNLDRLRSVLKDLTESYASHPKTLPSDTSGTDPTAPSSSSTLKMI